MTARFIRQNELLDGLYALYLSNPDLYPALLIVAHNFGVGDEYKSKIIQAFSKRVQVLVNEVRD